MGDWLGSVVTLEGASFTGFCNFGVIVVVIYTAVRKEPLSWALILQVLALMLLALLLFFACMAVVAFAGLP